MQIVPYEDLNKPEGRLVVISRSFFLVLSIVFGPEATGNGPGTSRKELLASTGE
jgi:hypothetical protein